MRRFVVVTNMEPAIRVKKLSKKFRLYANPWHRALEWATMGRRRLHKEFWALRDITFQVSRGECLGIIGPNGAGKTTLLKILSRSLYPTSGSFEIRGRALSLLELGTGFNLELTGRQNLYNSAHLLGLPAEYLEARIEDIIEFADLGEFTDRPVKLYSSGMYVRLAFSLFVFLEPEVLIIDEALSVGDIFFQQKSLAKIREITSGGTTCIFVSHDTAVIQNLCERAVVLDEGRVAFCGDVKEAVSRYFAAVGATPWTEKSANREAGLVVSSSSSDEGMMDPGDIIEHSILRNRPSRHGAGGLKVMAARVVDGEGRDTLQVEMSHSLTFYLLLRAERAVTAPSAGIELYDRLGNHVFAAGTRQLGHHLPNLSSGQLMVVVFKLTLDVQPGEYTFSLGASEPSPVGPNYGYAHDRIQNLGPLKVFFDDNKLRPFYGIARLQMTAAHYLVR